MKKILFLIIIVTILAVGGGMIYQWSKPETPLTIPASESQEPKEQTNVAVQKTIAGAPQYIIIPAIGVNAAIESVGLDAQGRMDVPQDEDNTAWYNLGFKPGQNGSAVIDGHYDKRSGAPAVFYKLSSLNEGDTIIVNYPDGTEYTFAVTHKQLYDFDKVPLQEVFNSTDQPRLNLITCDGVFDTAAQNYSKRLVVYSVLQE